MGGSTGMHPKRSDLPEDPIASAHKIEALPLALAVLVGAIVIALLMLTVAAIVITVTPDATIWHDAFGG